VDASRKGSKDPTQIFLLARYKFVARMRSRKYVLEVGCADALGRRDDLAVHKITVHKITNLQFDELGLGAR